MASIPLPALYVRPPQPQQDPLAQATRLVQLRSLLKAQPYQQQILQQQAQSGTLENKLRQYQFDQTQAINQAYKDAFTVDEDGNSTLDTKKLTQSLGNAGHGSAVPSIMKNYTEFQTSMADLQKKQADLQLAAQDSLGSLGAAFKAANYDPNLGMTLLQDRLNQSNLPPQMKASLLGFQQKLAQAPPGQASAMIKQIADNWIAQSPKQRELAAQEMAANARKQQADIAARRAGMNVPGNATDQPAPQTPHPANGTNPSEATGDLVNVNLSRNRLNLP